jgi:hypothetical protein
MSPKKQKTPIPHHGKKVNDWETLRPYVEMAAPPLRDNIAGEGETNAKIDPKWGFGYQAELSGNNSTFSPEDKSRAQK